MKNESPEFLVGGGCSLDRAFILIHSHKRRAIREEVNNFSNKFITLSSFEPKRNEKSSKSFIAVSDDIFVMTVDLFNYLK